MTKTEAKWAERVRQWRASGQTAAEFTRGEGYAPTTLWHWASVLKGRQRPRIEVPLVRVRRVRCVPESASAAVEIHVGGARVEVRAGFDKGLLRAVVEALQSES